LPLTHKVRKVICMKKTIHILLFPALCSLMVLLLAEAAATRAAALEALELCAHTVIPALFPPLAVSALLMELGFGAWAGPHLARWMTPLFRLPGSAGSALLLGLVGGYPIGARTAAALYRSRLLTRQESERLLTFCNNSSPVFFISVLGNGVFGSVRAGVWLWLIHVAAATLTGVLLSRRSASAPRQAPRLDSRRDVGVCSALVQAVRESAAGMLNLCGFVVLFYVLSRPLAAVGGRTGAALVGLTELFSLTPLVSADTFGFILSAACSGWGGLSVLFQTAAVLEDSGLSLRPCLVGKALHGVLSAALAAVLAGYVLG